MRERVLGSVTADEASLLRLDLSSAELGTNLAGSVLGLVEAWAP